MGHRLVAAAPGAAICGLGRWRGQASQASVRLLPAWQGGLVSPLAAIASAGTVMTARRDIT